MVSAFDTNKKSKKKKDYLFGRIRKISLKMRKVLKNCVISKSWCIILLRKGRKNMQLSLFLKMGRHKKGYTQKRVGEYCNISPKAISRYETGRAEPDFETLKKLVKFYNADINEIFDINPKRKSKKDKIVEKMKIFLQSEGCSKECFKQKQDIFNMLRKE